MRCKTFCDHDNEVARALGAGRAEALSRGTAPKAARAVVEKHAERSARAKKSGDARFAARTDLASDVVFAPGCTGCRVAPGEAEAELHAIDALTGAEARVVYDRCCGLPLLEAGDREGFAKSARAFLSALDGAKRAVFSDPGCLHALVKIAPTLGVTHTDGLVLEHTSELAARHLDRIDTVTIDEGPLRYHDPCRLGRGLGVYEAPRAVLAKIAGRPPGELHERRERAECSGAGGQLPRTDRASAEAIARERARDHALAGGGVLVTACPASKRAMSSAGIDTLGFGELLSRAVRR
jgi:Fe-S oxidoreductase